MVGLVLSLLWTPSVLIAADAPPKQWVIAHRGASGYLPEHSLESYALAYGMGADFIEPDVALSKDDHLICIHDIVLDSVTDVADKFPGRQREDGKFYVLDFTLEELKTLTAKGRKDSLEPGYQLATLDEMVTMIDRLNARTGRRVGTIPEPKNPSWHSKQGKPIEKPLLDLYTRHGYTRRTDPVIIQCFEMDALKRIRHDLGSDLTLLYLTAVPLSTKQLDDVARFADGIGPAKEMIEAGGKPVADGFLVREAHARNLKVVVYTLNDDEAMTRRFFSKHHVDGLFTDYPDIAVRARDRLPTVRPQSP